MQNPSGHGRGQARVTSAVVSARAWNSVSGGSIACIRETKEIPVASQLRTRSSTRGRGRPIGATRKPLPSRSIDASGSVCGITTAFGGCSGLSASHRTWSGKAIGRKATSPPWAGAGAITSRSAIIRRTHSPIHSFAIVSAWLSCIIVLARSPSRSG